MGKRTSPLDTHLCFSIYSAHLALQRTYKPVLDHLGVTYTQYLALSLLWAADRRTIGEMAGALDLEPSTMTPLLKRLEAGGFVKRKRDPDNERRVIVSLTAKGRRSQSDTGRLQKALHTGSGMSEDKLARLNRAVRSFRDALRDHLDQITS
ncbi:MAG: MarR family transcriptional regulator [Pseudomonadota bacterium]